jgi:hypothetical protein
MDNRTQIHTFIDECHTITMHALNEDVVVDKRVGRHGNGIYHEPLEQALLYLGMSMKQDQIVRWQDCQACPDPRTPYQRQPVVRAIPAHPLLQLQHPGDKAQEVHVLHCALLQRRLSTQALADTQKHTQVRHAQEEQEEELSHTRTQTHARADTPTYTYMCMYSIL